MSKAEQTRQFIIEKSAPIFNSKGYAGTALSDIMAATGLTKGCIYGNFKDKEEIALAAFDFNINKLFSSIQKKIENETGVVNRLNQMLDEHLNLYKTKSYANGCPILNASVDADDTNPKLRKRVQAALKRWRESLLTLLRQGIENGEIQAEIDVDAYATTYIALIEGGNMLYSLNKDIRYAKQAINHLRNMIDQELKV